MKSINSLIPDIQKHIGGHHGISDLLASDMGVSIAKSLQGSFGVKQHRGLRLSGLGPKCPRHLWYSVRHPELAEPLPPDAYLKFAYGHIIEHLVIGLAKAAGHEVSGEQDEINLDGILGHRDCVIDGCIVDVKSASTLSFRKFRDKTIAEDDSFGYLDQLDGYIVGSMDDPVVTVKDRGYLLAVDKQLGHLALYEHKVRREHIKQRIQSYKEIVDLSEPPSCKCGTEADGESGNIKLDVPASYSSFKHYCFPGLRTFLYSGGPRYLVKVNRLPRNQYGPIPEINKEGKYVYSS